MSKVQVHIVTTEFRISHGREPKGRGLWYFDAEIYNATEGMLGEEKEISAQGTYTQARKSVIERLKVKYPKAREIWISVLP